MSERDVLIELKNIRDKIGHIQNELERIKACIETIEEACIEIIEEILGETTT